MIYIRSKFNGMRPVTKQEAVEYVKWKMARVTMGKSSAECLAICNRSIVGYVVTQEDLQNDN